MSIFVDFSRKYIAALADLVAACSSRLENRALNVVTNPGFAIIYADPTDRYMLYLISRDQTRGTLVFNGEEIRHDGRNQVHFIKSEGQVLLERLLFPNISNDDFKPTISVVSAVPTILDGLAFASREFSGKYWSDRRFSRLTATDVPFYVGKESILLGLDLLHGFEIDDKPHEQLIEWVLVYGQRELIPVKDAQIRDLAVQHFSAATRAVSKPHDKAQFTKFLKSVEGLVETNVLLLGSYKSVRDAEDFDRLKEILSSFGYHGFLLKDASDVAVQSNVEKLFAGIMCSGFIIVLDTEPSGHIAEVSEMLRHPFRPAIIIRHEDRPATAFTEDSVQLANHIRVAVMHEITKQELLPHIKWARHKIAEHTVHYNKINSWRKAKAAKKATA